MTKGRDNVALANLPDGDALVAENTRNNFGELMTLSLASCRQNFERRGTERTFLQNPLDENARASERFVAIRR